MQGILGIADGNDRVAFCFQADGERFSCVEFVVNNQGYSTPMNRFSFQLQLLCCLQPSLHSENSQKGLAINRPERAALSTGDDRILFEGHQKMSAEKI
jgi:hypothetical protein